ncbi:DAK2 domain-containing protein [Nocardioides marmoriginsengisoli]|uniref:DAK2 domain-containing protein n=1 Tax=Nocardioides marmoriginsengisoli TaxID=661483 RepID=A0A3N0CPX4_9ACTN|nr:DAK2 domain-containing protein [Nocardioides marmoriginsengisoli]RNL65508.1 DAK2 domain-containing protein [Nocardioides marmoriginsengisoli]
MSTGTRGEAIATFDLGAVVRFADLAVQGLASAREEIDALNVYPVPDGDTGTNMYLTVESARGALREHLAEADGEPDLRDALQVYAKAALLGARGNSGVILSQLIGALLRRMGQGGPEDRSATLMAEGFAQATEAAYAAVGTPVEGTMLSVAKAASIAAAARAEDPEAHLGDVLKAAAAAAREALARTPDQMQLLRDAGVVDAGGRGLCVILDAAESAVTGQRPMSAPAPIGAHAIPTPLPTGDLTEDGPAYEVMYLLDAEDDAIGGLRARLGELGDSLVVVGGDGLWNVHVHTDDVGAAVEAGIDAGRPRRIRVTHFAEQVTRARQKRSQGAGSRGGRAVVAVVAGDGLAGIFAEAGARVLVGRPGLRPSTGEILDAILASGAEEVVVLPNDPDSLSVAEAAAAAAEESADVRVVVVPTRAQVQGIAAIAVHEPGRAFDADVVQMTSAARGTRHGAVTVAVKQAMTTAGPCETGDVLGVLQGDFAVVGSDLVDVATAILERMLTGGGELVTLVGGADAGDLVERCESWIEANHAGVDVVVYDGGQERYPLLLAVE